MVRRSEALPSTIQHHAGIGSTDSVTAHRVNRYLWQVCSDTFPADAKQHQVRTTLSVLGLQNTPYLYIP
jgi:hypothetical protein